MFCSEKRVRSIRGQNCNTNWGAARLRSSLGGCTFIPGPDGTHLL